MAVSLSACVPDSPSQLWTLQFGGWGSWSSGTDFTDAQIPVGGTDTYSRTFGLIDTNGDGLADACIRRNNGVWCARNTGAGAFAAGGWTQQAGWNDNAGWLASAYGSTLKYGYPNSTTADPFVCGRGVGGYFCGDFAVNQLFGWTAQFSDANGWNMMDSYFGSIGLADVNGDGFADVCGRGTLGIWCTLRTAVGQFQNPGSVWTTQFSDQLQWAPDAYGTTIQYGDINGDGAVDVCGRGVDGVWCAVSSPASGQFIDDHIWSYQGPSTLANFTSIQGCVSAANRWACYAPGVFGSGDLSDQDAHGTAWSTDPSYYRSIRLVDINRDGLADLCARGKTGLVCAYSNGTSFGPMRPVLNRVFTDAMGWKVDKYGSSMTFGNLAGDKGIGVCGRGTGVYCATISGN